MIKGLIGIACIGAAAVGTRLTYNSYRDTFLVSKERLTDPHKLPRGEQHAAVSSQLHELIDEALKLQYEDIYIDSEDGLRLHARYYEIAPGAPIELMIHGYRSNPIRDLCGCVHLAVKMKHNILMIDQRAHGDSDGKCLTFGIKERKDCKLWAKYLQNRFGNETPVLLTGVSMGASTVMMASTDLPENVKGIIADSGYTSPEEIIRKVLKDRGMEADWIYTLVDLSAKIFGRFHLAECCAKEELSKCRIPVLFIHGKEDHFVPCEMTEENYHVCSAPKQLLIVNGAGHGLGYVVDPDGYEKAVKELLADIADFNR